MHNDGCMMQGCKTCTVMSDLSQYYKDHPVMKKCGHGGHGGQVTATSIILPSL